MEIRHYPKTDALYIALQEKKTSIESSEVANGIVLDYDENGEVIGIEIDSQASKKVDLGNINFVRVETKSAVEDAA